jgi:hypothetical protein
MSRYMPRAAGALPSVFSRVVFAGMLAVSVAALPACAPAMPQGQPRAVVAAVIVKPRLPMTAGELEASVQRIVGDDAGVRHVRTLAGDAHLLHLTSPSTAEQVPAMIERLRASGAYRYVELDSTMKRQ